MMSANRKNFFMGIRLDFLFRNCCKDSFCFAKNSKTAPAISHVRELFAVVTLKIAFYC